MLLNREVTALLLDLFPGSVGDSEQETWQVFFQNRTRLYELLLEIHNRLAPSTIDAYITDMHIFDSALKKCFPETHEIIKAGLTFLVMADQLVDNIYEVMIDRKDRLLRQYKWLGSVFFQELLAGSLVSAALVVAQTSVPEEYTISLKFNIDFLLKKFQQLQDEATVLKIKGVLFDIVSDVAEETKKENHEGNEETGSKHDLIADTGCQVVWDAVYTSWRLLENLAKSCHLSESIKKRLTTLAHSLVTLVRALSDVVFNAEDGEHEVILCVMKNIIHRTRDCFSAGCEQSGKKSLLFFSVMKVMRKYLLQTLLRDAESNGVMTAYQQWRLGEETEDKAYRVDPKVHHQLNRLKDVLWIYIKDVHNRFFKKSERWPNDLVPEMDNLAVTHFLAGVAVYPCLSEEGFLKRQEANRQRQAHCRDEKFSPPPEKDEPPSAQPNLRSP
jgi:hypothetical protein